MRNLILHIEQIKDKDLYRDFEEKPETFPILAKMVQNRECEFLAPLKISVRAYRIRELFEIEGRFQTQTRLACSRCLQNFDQDLMAEFALTYTKALPDLNKESVAAEVELRAEQIGLIYFKGEEIHLQDGIQEQIVMAFPIKPLCQQQCKGLCPTCGVDLNREDCGCRQEPHASTFAILKDLKLNKKKPRP